MKLAFQLIFVFSFIIFLNNQTALAREIKFIQITDSHFSSTAGEHTQQEVEGSGNTLRKTINDINSISNVDFVVFTGDNIDQADSVSLKKFLSLANKLKYPYYIVIGNHEVFKSQHFTKKDYMKVVRKYSKNCRSKNANYEFKKKGVIFLVVDGAKEVIPGPAGYYKKDTLKWLDKKLTHYKNSKVVILQHFPVVAPYYNRTHSTYNVKDYENILSKHANVIAVISGHYHSNGETMQNGIYHISTPALIEAPHNFKIIEVEVKNQKDYSVYTQLRHAEDL